MLGRLGAIIALWILVCNATGADGAARRPPNIILIMADDLGVAELGCTGSTRIETPTIDRLAERGMVFTNAYSGSTVCAPSRCTLLTGLHTGHAQIRDNGEIPNLTGPAGADGTTEIGPWKEPGEPHGLWGGQRGLAPDTPTLARALQTRGYATGCVGKWGLGGPATTGLPAEQGFDDFFGYLCQRNAHNYYPRYLTHNTPAGVRRVSLPGNTRGRDGAVYATDRMLEHALGFIDAHAESPFFLYVATPVPHLALQVPDDSLREYTDRWDVAEDPPYTGGRGYLAHDRPRAAYAAMVTRMDRDIGTLLDRIESHGLTDDTLIIFTSDNGSTFDLGGYDPVFFDGTGGLRGHKTNLYEGGIRVPLIATWPGRIAPGSADDMVVANWDLFTTLCTIAGAKPPAETDGIDLAPVLLGTGDAPEREHLYWEFHAGAGSQAIRMGRWKGIRTNVRKASSLEEAPIQLYDLGSDPNETTDVSAAHPEVVERVRSLMRSERTTSSVARWNF